MPGSDPLMLSAPWSTTIALGLPLRWAIELDVDGKRVLWTDDIATGRAWKGAAFHADEARLVCAAAELDRMNPTWWREILASLPRLPRRLTWLAQAPKKRGQLAWEGFDPGCGLDPSTAGTGTLNAVLRRLGASLADFRTMERSQFGATDNAP